MPFEPLSETIVERLEGVYGWKVKTEDIVLVPGVVTGFNLACHAFGKPGDGLVVQPPVYHPILEANTHVGMRRLDAGLARQADGAYAVDWERFEAAFAADARMFLLCNPHNPVGRVYRRDELERMAQTCLRNGTMIVSDEIHCDLIYSRCCHVPIASLDLEVAQNTITLMAPSKSFNLAGLQCSFAVIQNPSLRARYKKARGGLVGWVNVMGLIAGLAAYRDGGPWLEELLEYLEGNLQTLASFLKAEMPDVEMAAPEGTYLAWLDFRKTGIQGSPCKFFLDRARVGLSDGEDFGPGGQGFVRLNFGCPRPMLLEALERMKAALRSL
jgi:cystathionine beta-lyase